MFETVVVNFGRATRTEVLEGRKYLVAPMVMITHGVHKGSAGAFYYPEAELAKTAGVWNHKPLVVYHPEKDGQPVSACTPEQIEKRKIGLVMNTRYDAKRGKLRAEAWIDVEKAAAVDPRIEQAVNNGSITEVSTGLVVDAIKSPGSKFGGKGYDLTAVNLRPDHLAILPDQKGACSVADGAGLLQLNMAWEDAEDVWDQTVAADWADPVNRKFPIRNQADVYAAVQLNGFAKDPAAVRNAVVTIANKLKLDVPEVLLANAKLPAPPPDPTRTEPMDKKKAHVDTLIGNGYEEADREWLMKMNEAELLKIKPVANKQPDPAPAAKPATVEEYIGNAPADIKELLSDGVAAARAEKTALIDAITKAPGNIWTADQLKEFPIANLRAAYALIPKSAAPVTPASPLYTGLNVPNAAQPAAHQTPKGGTLKPPKLEYAKK